MRDSLDRPSAPEARERKTEVAAALSDTVDEMRLVAGQLLENASYNIVNPINAILGCCELIKGAKQVSPEIAEPLHLIEQSGQELLELAHLALQRAVSSNSRDGG